MIDVNQITSTLRGMPDQQLQQYAAMHKSDPYILSLAVSESNQRKKMRMAAQGQGGGQQMPKVADAAIAGMAQQQLPEDQGIAQIPAPNMQRMADGGIAGYGDDEGMATGGMGGMFNFAQQSEPVVRMSGGGHIPRYQGVPTAMGGDGSVVTSGDMYTQQLALRAKYEKEATEMGEGTRREFSPDVKAYAQQLYKSSNTSQADYLAKEQKRTLEGSPLRSKTAPAMPDRFKAPEVAATTAPELIIPYGQSKATNVLGNAPPAPPAPPPTPSAAPAPQATLSTGLPSLAQSKKMSEELYDTKKMEQMVDQQRLQQRQDIANQTEARAEKMAAFNKEQGPAFAGYEKLLKSEELQDATDKEKSGLMALMKGFLGMAAGESPNAATNIAKGAMMGLGEYGDALKEFKKAAKERNKAMADIENARRSEARGDFKSQQDYEEKASDRLSKVDQHATDAVLGIVGKKGEGAVNLAREMIQQSGANARTMAQINAPGQTERLIDRMARDPKFAESYKDFASIGPGVKGDAALLAKYAGPQGQIALQMLEAEGPEGKLQAQLIRQKLQAAMLTPMSKPTGPVRE